MAPQDPSAGPDLIEVGRFGAPHGVRGEIRIKSYTADPLALAGYPNLTDRTGTRAFAIVRARLLKEDMLVATIEGSSSREAAAALTNTSIYMPRSALPPPDEDEFYLADLIGLAVKHVSGDDFGTVTNVVNYGAGDILEIALADGTSTMIPFTKEAVPEIRTGSGFLVVDPPAEVEAREETDRDRNEEGN